MMRAVSMLFLLALCGPGCDRGSSALAERVEGYCAQVTARFTSWASAPAQMATAIDVGNMSREVSFCLRVREGDAAPLVQQASEHLDALATSAPADAGPHLDAILAMLNEASRRPLVR